MKRAITLLTSLAIIVMTIATLANINTAIRLFMGETTLDIVGRLIVLVGLVALAFTNRPRTIALRGALGAIGLAVLTVALYETFNYQLAMLDGLVYFIGATSLLIEALEPDTAPAVTTAGSRNRTAAA